MTTPTNEWLSEFINRLTYIRDIHDDVEDVYNREFHGTQNDVAQVISFIQNLLNQHSSHLVERISEVINETDLWRLEQTAEETESGCPKFVRVNREILQAIDIIKDNK